MQGEIPLYPLNIIATGLRTEVTLMKNYSNIINGLEANTGTPTPVINPATGTPFATVSDCSKDDVNQAVAAARAAFLPWSQLSYDERAEYLMKLAKVLEDNMPELMQLLTQETGKPMGGLNGIGSGMEVGGAIGWTQYTSTLRLEPEILQDGDGMRLEAHYKPLGVVASITPWNWPLMIAIWHIMPALLSGNTVVIKPSPFTPVATARFVALANQVLPAGVLNLVLGGPEIGATLTSHADVNKIIFTGSTATGRKIMETASATLKRLTLELGGNDAGIVLPDADVDSIANALFTNCFHNNGQTCAALKRLYVHDSLYDAVVSKLVEMANMVKVGNGLEDGTELGPLQNINQLNIVKDLAKAAIEEGGTVVAGGKPIDGPGYFFEPTLVTGLTNGNRLVDEEQFGPIVPIIRYTDIDEVISLANQNSNGLGGSFWTSNIAKASELATRLECGSVWINDHGAVKPNAPFGGIKQSGMGVEFGEHGLREYTSLQTLHIPK